MIINIKHNSMETAKNKEVTYICCEREISDGRIFQLKRSVKSDN